LRGHLRNLPAIIYAGLLYGFIFLPVVVLVLYSFQESRIPVPPFNGPSLKWYQAVFDDARMLDALANSG
jgi:spermidine/putrescine transport system permease protein